MTESTPVFPSTNWPLWQKMAFRFFCIYFLLMIAPWFWLYGYVPGLGYLADYYYTVRDWVIELCNRYLFHFEKITIVNNGSGDSSQNWKTILTYLILALAGCLLWSLLDRKRKSYTKANYWLRTLLRYYLIMTCFSYGINKLFALQMPFPTQSQLATPLGDFLPMRLSWMFIGYSTPYEMFSGAMEVLAGLLLLNRKTITAGLLLALTVFSNVMILNLCYDIPVKTFSIHLVIYCLYLLAHDSKRLMDFFVFNRAVNGNTIYHINFPKKWMRVTRIVLKLVFIGLFGVYSFYDYAQFSTSFGKPINTAPIKPGIYDVVVFAVNKDTIPPLLSDTLRWQNMIFETHETYGNGSVGSTDTAFRQRYRRGYFHVDVDSAKQTLDLKKTSNDSVSIASFHFTIPDSNTIRLLGIKGKDSLYVLLKKSTRHFQLAEKQFHWISEANR